MPLSIIKMEANDLLSKLNDRSLSFPSRCSIAASLLNPQNIQNRTCTWSFPRKNQYIFDWFTGSLIKFARATPPKAEIILSKPVWNLMKNFSDILSTQDSKSSKNGTFVSVKRRFITNDEEFFDYKNSFDPQGFIIKCPLLTIFQSSLSLLSVSFTEGGNSMTTSTESETFAESEMICSVILAFLQQNRVSLPVSFSQVTEFIRSLVQSRANLSSGSFCQVLRPTLSILIEIVLGGAANYKKTYPLLVKFCLQSPKATECSEEEQEIWISFIEKCLFSQEFIDELLNFMTCPSMIKVLDSSSAQVSESSFPKSLTFQRTLFIELSTEPLAVQSCPLIYEAFLRSAGSRINRETGFNFFTFLLRNVKVENDQVTKLISILQSRGNEIYQQRNDEIYRKQSSIIEEIFTSAMRSITPYNSYNLLLSIAKLNYYLVSEKLGEILNTTESVSAGLVEFIIGMFELAALANQLSILLKTILKSNLPLTILKSSKLQLSLMKIFRTSLSPFSLHQIYLSLIAEDLNQPAALVLMVPVMRSITKVVDNVETFDKEKFMKFQALLIEKGDEESLNLLAEIVRWTPGTNLLIKTNFESVPRTYSMLNLLLVLKCKNLISRVQIENITSIPRGYNLLMKYLPIIADDMSEKELKSFSHWLLENEEECIKVLSESAFYEIIPLRYPFIQELISYCIKASSNNISVIIGLIPWEYLTDEMTAELIKCLWNSPSIVSQLLKMKNRKDTLSILKDCEEFIDFLLLSPDDDLISKSYQLEHSIEFIQKTLNKLHGKELCFKARFVSKMIKYLNDSDNQVNTMLFKFIETEIDPITVLQTDKVSIEFVDSLDTILEWTLNSLDNKEEFVAKCILRLPSNNVNLALAVRCQAMRCKYPARNDMKFIEESVELASKLDGLEFHEVIAVFKKDLMSLIKGLPIDHVKELIESFIFANDSWRFALGLQAITQLLHVTTTSPVIYALFVRNVQELYEKSVNFDMIPGFLASLKSIVQLKKNVTWESEMISDILGVLRKVRQSKPQSYDEVYTIQRLIVSLHIRRFRNLIPLLITTICECFNGIGSVDESVALGRVLSELGSLKRTELEPFVLLPLLYTFITTKYANAGIKKPLQLAMTSLMYHLGTKKQLLQLLSTALISEHEHRVILKAFIDEYNKFHKYSGRA